MKFLDFINSAFYKVKEKFKHNINKTGLSFNDDVFSDTIIKCNDQIKDKDSTEQELLNYFWISFKNNTLRDLKYSRNNTNELDDNFDIINETYSELIDEHFNNVSNIIKKQFGDELYKLFSMHANGATYAQLYKITNQDKLKYKFRKIREFVKKVYDLS